MTHETAFILRGKAEREAAANTDSAWKVVQDERVEASVYPRGWETSGFDDAAWPQALEVRRP